MACGVLALFAVLPSADAIAGEQAQLMLLQGQGAVSQRVPVRLDLHRVQAAAPGAATCAETDPDQNARAAKISSRLRAGRGLPPLRAHADLARAAARHACDMARRGVMSHEGSSSKGPGQRLRQVGYRPRITAENIAAGPFDMAAVLSIWNNSAGHHANLMHPNVRDFGIGHAVGADGKTVFWAAVYAVQ